MNSLLRALGLACLLLFLPVAAAADGQATEIGKCTDPSNDVAQVNVFENTGAKYLVINIFSPNGEHFTFVSTKSEVPKILDLGDKAAVDKSSLKPGDKKLYGSIAGNESTLMFMRVNSKSNNLSAMVIAAGGKNGVFLLNDRTWGELKPLIKTAERKL